MEKYRQCAREGDEERNSRVGRERKETKFRRESREEGMSHSLSHRPTEQGQGS